MAHTSEFSSERHVQTHSSLAVQDGTWEPRGLTSAPPASFPNTVLTTFHSCSLRPLLQLLFPLPARFSLFCAQPTHPYCHLVSFKCHHSKGASLTTLLEQPITPYPLFVFSSSQPYRATRHCRSMWSASPQNTSCIRRANCLSYCSDYCCIDLKTGSSKTCAFNSVHILTHFFHSNMSLMLLNTFPKHYF